MKTPILISFFLFSFASLLAQVPNGGFESWANGSPTNWFSSNIPSIVINITSESPGHNGVAARGEVINYAGNPYSPLLTSVDMSFNGFAISQSYANFSFYYKLNITGTARFEASVTFYDSGGNWVASGGDFLTGTVNTYTLANFPIYYGSANQPVEAIIIFAIHDTVAADPPVGNYFIVDDVALSGIVGIHEAGEIKFPQSFPNPATDVITIAHNDFFNGESEITVYDLFGKEVMKFHAENNVESFQFSIAHLSSGIYHAKITSGESQLFTKIMKQ